MRPKSITLFERFYLASLVIMVINFFWSFDTMVAQIQRDPAMGPLGWGAGAVIAIFAVSLAISLLLWFFAARRRSVIAKWILVIFAMIGVWSLSSTFAAISSAQLIAPLLVTVLQIAATILLFRADAKPWFAGNKPWFAGKGPDEADPATFD